MKVKKILLFIVVILSVLCMCIIFYFSSQDSGSTNILSKNVTRKIAEIKYLFFHTAKTKYMVILIRKYKEK